jgi:hypothetical protein
MNDFTTAGDTAGILRTRQRYMTAGWASPSNLLKRRSLDGIGWDDPV